MFGADQLIAHAVGDYVLQSDWMAQEKTKRPEVALFHAFVYSLSFICFFDGMSRRAWLVIFVTHAIIDHFRLARYVVWAKNWIALTRAAPTPPWSECKATGYPPEKPMWMSVWLLIITDNIMHVIINALALEYL